MKKPELSGIGLAALLLTAPSTLEGCAGKTANIESVSVGQTEFIAKQVSENCRGLFSDDYPDGNESGFSGVWLFDGMQNGFAACAASYLPEEICSLTPTPEVKNLDDAEIIALECSDPSLESSFVNSSSEESVRMDF